MKYFESANPVLREIFRIILVVAGAVLMAVNINTFVHSAGLLPGGFTGLSLLIQEIFQEFIGIHVPYSVLSWLLNLVPAAVCFKYVGKKFTVYSAVMIVLSGLLTDIIPGFDVTDDVLLSAIFGGLVNGLSICLCLFAGATSGGTDFIAIFVSEKTGKDAWNYIFMGNMAVLATAGFLFGWNVALYSIVFQFASTQVLNTLYKRYQKTTLLIISDKHEEIYRIINETTNHDATLFRGIGCYRNTERNMLYTVISEDEVNGLVKKIRSADTNAFINILQSKELLGKFFMKPND